MLRILSILVTGAALVACGPEGPAETDAQATDDGPEARLEQLGIELRPAPPPTANFVRAVTSGTLVFLSGHGPDLPGGGQVTGKVGPTGLSLEQAQEAARLTGIALLTSLKEEIDDLDRVSRIVKVTGMVNAEPSFTQHSQVINGFSDLMVEVFGDRGRHARASVGMNSLPNDIAVEIDMIVEIMN